MNEVEVFIPPLDAYSKIDQWGAGKDVLALRQSMSCEEIATIINKKYRPPGEEPLNKITVKRYCEKHLTAVELANIDKGIELARFDVLGEALKLRKRLDKHSDKLQKVIDNLQADEEKLSELASISNAYIKSIEALQTLNERASKLQKEQLGVEKVRKALRLLMDVLNRYPEVKAEFYRELRESEDYDLIRSI